jgi:hypothetical protein
VVWRTTAVAATITDMSDALQIILGDPELQSWPHRGPAATTADDAAELAPAPFTAPRLPEPHPAPAALFDPALETPAPLTTALTAPTYPAPPAPDNAHVNDTAPLTAVDRDPATAPYRDDTYDPPADNSAATAPQTHDDNHHDDAPNSAPTPVAFDEIVRPRRPVADKFEGTAEWVKNNWRRPKTAITALAAVLAAVSLAAWASTNTAPPQPTATITAPSTDPAAAPTASPTDTPLTVKTAAARCPAPSTDPMNAAAPAGGQPWICVRAWGIDGQVLTVTLAGPAVISAVAIVPGANTEAGGEDQWVRYRTVERVSWTFNDAARTTITQCTDSRRDLLTQSVSAPDCAGVTPRGPVIASQVEITIEKTAAPPSAPTGGAISAGPLGAGNSTSGSPSAFAVSRIQVIGHPAS